jgi:hypothetical protein
MLINEKKKQYDEKKLYILQEMGILIKMSAKVRYGKCASLNI